MTLGEALGLVEQRKAVSRRRKVFLVCGFQPLHLARFLQGHFAERFPDEAADIEVGLYGDLEGSLSAARSAQAEAAVLVLEWADIDPRLGLRSAGGWAVSVQADIVESCRGRLNQLLAGLRSLAASVPAAVVPPTLPLTLLGHTAGWQSSLSELELQKQVAEFCAEAGRIEGVSVLNSSRLARVSPEATRVDAMMDLRAGFPYTVGHASAVASQAVSLLFPPVPMKGLITDLDETVWSGIVGEVGADGVSWSLAEHTQIHGLYQQLLRHFSEMGVLLAIASKNEPSVVEEALRREDLLVPANSLFPVCANWGPKSHSVAEILRTWNVGAESVVFVDDSAMELDEVRRSFPGMTCLQFSKKQPAKTLEVFEKLRDLFGKAHVQREDALRQASIRANAAVQEAGRGGEGGGASGGEFVRGLQGRLTFDSVKNPSNTRLLELINKTNQFNLNGVRLTEGEWKRHLADPAGVVVSVSYEDRFGPLGVIGVVAGTRDAQRLSVSTWVMSCRAFSRRIEFHTLDYLFGWRDVAGVALAFRSTQRNSPLQDFISSVGLPVGDEGELVLTREAFQQRSHELPHTVADARHERAPGASDT